jgi:hypothetical protein
MDTKTVKPVKNESYGEVEQCYYSRSPFISETTDKIKYANDFRCTDHPVFIVKRLIFRNEIQIRLQYYSCGDHYQDFIDPTCVPIPTKRREY